MCSRLAARARRRYRAVVMTSPHVGHLDLARVEALTRDVINAYALPVEILSVDVETFGWRMLLRDMSHCVIDISIAYATSAAELRANLKQRLDAACL
jgi:hypothetical protein